MFGHAACTSSPAWQLLLPAASRPGGGEAAWADPPGLLHDAQLVLLHAMARALDAVVAARLAHLQLGVVVERAVLTRPTSTSTAGTDRQQDDNKEEEEGKGVTIPPISQLRRSSIKHLPARGPLPWRVGG